MSKLSGYFSGQCCCPTFLPLTLQNHTNGFTDITQIKSTFVNVDWTRLPFCKTYPARPCWMYCDCFPASPTCRRGLHSRPMISMKFSWVLAIQHAQIQTVMNWLSCKLMETCVLELEKSFKTFRNHRRGLIATSGSSERSVLSEYPSSTPCWIRLTKW